MNFAFTIGETGVVCLWIANCAVTGASVVRIASECLCELDRAERINAIMQAISIYFIFIIENVIKILIKIIYFIIKFIVWLKYLHCRIVWNIEK